MHFAAIHGASQGMQAMPTTTRFTTMPAGSLSSQAHSAENTSKEALSTSLKRAQQQPQRPQQPQEPRRGSGCEGGGSAGSGAKARQGRERTVLIKDPSAKHSIAYYVPASKITPTQGSLEHSNAGPSDGGHRASHRACLCKLHLEGRCGQGAKCKSFHVDPAFVAQCRRENDVELETCFLNEVVVRMPRATHDTVFAVRFPAVLGTKGLEAYKRAVKRGSVRAALLCPKHNPSLGESGTCAEGKACPHIHVRHAELKDLAECRLRTPCCNSHGDQFGEVCQSVTVTVDGMVWEVPPEKIALTARDIGSVENPQDVCIMHARSRCKYGRCCEKLHVCRVWAANNGLLAALNEAYEVMRDDPAPSLPAAPPAPAQKPVSAGAASQVRTQAQTLPVVARSWTVTVPVAMAAPQAAQLAVYPPMQQPQHHLLHTAQHPAPLQSQMVYGPHGVYIIQQPQVQSFGMGQPIVQAFPQPQPQGYPGGVQMVRVAVPCSPADSEMPRLVDDEDPFAAACFRRAGA